MSFHGGGGGGGYNAHYLYLSHMNFLEINLSKLLFVAGAREEILSKIRQIQPEFFILCLGYNFLILV